MKNSDIKDPLFLAAVEAIDAGNISSLKDLLSSHPQLVCNRLHYPVQGYFKDPYLLWFIADNPIRHQKLPANITAIATLLIDAVQHNTPETFQQQMDFALELVVTGSVPHQCGVQIPLMDILIDAGAVPGNAHGALAHGNIAAAAHLAERGAQLTLATAICLNSADDILLLAKESGTRDREIALVAAAFFGKTEMLVFLVKLGVNVNVYLDALSGFHHHATALHQAVFSGSLEAVKVLVEAGADLNAKDLVYGGTALGWSTYMQTEIDAPAIKEKYKVIEKYLQGKSGK